MGLSPLVPTPAEMVTSAVRRKLASIDRHAARLQDEHLVHDGHHFYADPGSLATITTTLAIVQMLPDADPVPTPPPVTGCWLTADASYARATIGAGIVLFASYLDCCDGEIARLKLLASLADGH